MRSTNDQPTIEIIPVGEAPGAILEGMLPVLEARFPGRVVRLARQGLPHPKYALVSIRRQYEANLILDRLDNAATTERLLGVTDLDLFSAGLNFIFGQARIGGPPAIMTLARLRPEFWGQPANPQLLQDRAIKEAVHELGHTYGLQHCDVLACVMYFSNRLEETDRKTDCFCPEHRAQLERALSIHT
jgi:archaemetzincin